MSFPTCGMNANASVQQRCSNMRPSCGYPTGIPAFILSPVDHTLCVQPDRKKKKRLTSLQEVTTFVAPILLLKTDGRKPLLFPRCSRRCRRFLHSPSRRTGLRSAPGFRNCRLQAAESRSLFLRWPCHRSPDQCKTFR